METDESEKDWIIAALCCARSSGSRTESLAPRQLKASRFVLANGDAALWRVAAVHSAVVQHVALAPPGDTRKPKPFTSSSPMKTGALPALAASTTRLVSFANVADPRTRVSAPCQHRSAG
jgi:hypothetical protein